MTRWLLALLFSLGLAVPALADDAAEANAAYARGDYETALRLITPFAERGDSQAQFTLGVMYERGQGTTPNDAEAVRWYRLSAEQGNPAAQMNLGLMHAKGRGVPVNYLEAYRWLDRAAASYPAGEKRDKAIRNRDLALSKMTPEEMAQVPLRTHHVAAAQAALKRLGYDPGPADGLVGPRTREAVKAFQRDRGLPETGELSHQLILMMTQG